MTRIALLSSPNSELHSQETVLCIGAYDVVYRGGMARMVASRLLDELCDGSDAVGLDWNGDGPHTCRPAHDWRRETGTRRCAQEHARHWYRACYARL